MHCSNPAAVQERGLDQVRPAPWEAQALLTCTRQLTVCLCCSVSWWATWLHFWGGVCFFMTGIFQYWYAPQYLAQSCAC